ncbi:hypothetical protein [Fournierella sp.]|nr:hypothetical protein [Fournierella sp.]
MSDTEMMLRVIEKFMQLEAGDKKYVMGWIDGRAAPPTMAEAKPA